MGGHIVVALEEAVGIAGEELLRHFRLGPAHALQEQGDVGAGHLMGSHAVGQGALGNGLLETALHGRNCQHIDHGGTARGFAGDGDAIRVAAEEFDVLMDPLERQDLVRQAAVGIKILTAGEGGEVIEAQHVHAVLEGDEHQPVPGEGFAVVDPVAGSARIVSAAMDPNEDRQLFALQRPLDIHEQAVFTAAGLALVELYRRGAVFLRVEHALPGGFGKGALEAQRAHRSFSVRDAQVFHDAVSLVASDLAAVGLYNVLCHGDPPFYLFVCATFAPSSFKSSVLPVIS